MVDNPDFTPSQVGGLFTFLARQLAKPNNTLFVNRNLFDQVQCCQHYQICASNDNKSSAIIFNVAQDRDNCKCIFSLSVFIYLFALVWC